MAWFISGDKRDLVLGVSASGQPNCHGVCKHELKPPGLDDYNGEIDHTLLARIGAARSSWSMVTSADSGGAIHLAGDGLLQRVQDSPQKTHGMAKFYTEAPDAVAFVLVVPVHAFEPIHRLFELVLTSTSLSYVIAITFLGFRLNTANAMLPSWQEFVAGRPMVFSEFELSVRASQGGA